MSKRAQKAKSPSHIKRRAKVVTTNRDGTPTSAAFYRMVDSLDQREHGRKVTCPYLLVAGEMENLCTPKDMKDFMRALSCLKDMWLYEGVFHPMRVGRRGER